MSEWQPIDSAPKDGTTILVATTDLESPVVAAYWQQDAWFHGWMVWSSRSDGWQVYATHWMKLPAPPK